MEPHPAPRPGGEHRGAAGSPSLAIGAASRDILPAGKEGKARRGRGGRAHGPSGAPGAGGARPVGGSRSGGEGRGEENGEREDGERVPGRRVMGTQPRGAGGQCRMGELPQMRKGSAVSLELREMVNSGHPLEFWEDNRNGNCQSSHRSSAKLRVLVQDGD